MAEGDAPQNQLPPDILQQLIPMMQGGGAAPQAAPAMPQSAPQQPQGPQQSPMGPTSPFDLASTVRQVSQLPEYQQASGRLEQIGGQEQDIQKQMAGMQPPKMGPGIEKGAGFFHNLGQALLMISQMTGAGRNLNQAIYGPGIEKYDVRQKSLGNQLAALKDQEAIPTEELRATTGLTQAAGLAGYRGQMAAAATSKAATAKERADAYVQSVANQHQNMIKNWDFKKASQDEKSRHNIVGEAQAAVNEAGRNYREQNRDATTEDVAAVMSGTRTQIANEAAARDPSVKSWLFNALGIDVPQVQNAPSPEFRPTPKAGTSGPSAAPTKPAPKPKAGGTQFHYDKQGNRVAGP